GLRVEQAEHATERVVAGNPMFQPQYPPQQRFLGATELGHVRTTLRTAKDRSHRDKENFQQIVLCVVRPWVRHPSKNPSEFPHLTPLPSWESSSESMLPANAIPSSNPYAIPLHAGGRRRAGWGKRIDFR